jgi:SprT-like protein
MNDQQLQAWVEQISTQCFGRPFIHRASFNSRLRTTGGRYSTRTHDIDISRTQLETFGPEEVEKIIKHELCHYHLHLLNKGYKHRDADFKNLLKQVGGSRFCRAIPGTKRAQSYRYRYICVDCQADYYRKRKVDVRKYGCGKCRGKLKSVQLDFNNKS